MLEKKIKFPKVKNQMNGGQTPKLYTKLYAVSSGTQYHASFIPPPVSMQIGIFLGDTNDDSLVAHNGSNTLKGKQKNNKNEVQNFLFFTKSYRLASTSCNSSSGRVASFGKDIQSNDMQQKVFKLCLEKHCQKII